MKRKVYIIHSHKDEASASVTCRSLKENGLRCVSGEPSNLRGRARGYRKIIADSDVVILMISASANNSTQVKQELEWAVKADKVIIPFRIDSAPLPKYLEFYVSTTH